MTEAWQSAFIEVLPDFSNFRQKAIPGITKHLSDAGDQGGVDASRSFGSSFAGGIGRVVPFAGSEFKAESFKIIGIAKFKEGGKGCAFRVVIIIKVRSPIVF